MDEDGYSYLRQMRKSARDARRLEWLTSYADSINAPLGGFVWEEDGKIIGNLTLIPLQKHFQRVFLVANVAVLPEFRRKGIGELLTKTALGYLREIKVYATWLQVRRDNPPACNLYQKLGFNIRFTRTTWHGKVTNSAVVPTPFLVTNPSTSDWAEMLKQFESIYPRDVIWNLPVDLNVFKPGILSAVGRIISGSKTQCWVVKKDKVMIGCLGWEAARTWTDNVWVGCKPEDEEDALRSLLPVVLSTHHRTRPQSINYPADKAVDLFTSFGFIDHSSLHWMEIVLTPSHHLV